MKSGGFTLIELIAVIVILGILSAVAIPRYIDLENDAARAATSALAGNISGASVVNFAAVRLGNPGAVAVGNCNELGALLEGGLPSGFVLNDLAMVPGNSTECVVENTRYSFSVSFRAMGASL